LQHARSISVRDQPVTENVGDRCRVIPAIVGRRFV
jgi:hypothetical protein